jgi:hypothetical protein
MTCIKTKFDYQISVGKTQVALTSGRKVVSVKCEHIILIYPTLCSFVPNKCLIVNGKKLNMFKRQKQTKRNYISNCCGRSTACNKGFRRKSTSSNLW